MQQKLLSIIIPVYNAEKYLKECIDSIVKQSYKNFELILVDDGSTDLSGQICDEYAAIDTRIKTYHINNSGPSTARNYGIKVMSGEYLAFVDADDEVGKDAYKQIVDEIEKSGAEMGIFNWEVWDELNNFQHKSEFGCSGIVQSEIIQKMILFSDEKGGGGFPWNRVIKTSTLKENGAEIPLFHEDILVNEDKCWVVDVLNIIKRAVISDFVGYRYYVRNNGLTHRTIADKLPDEIISWNYIAESLKKVNRFDKYTKSRFMELMTYGLVRLIKYQPDKAWVIWKKFKKEYQTFVSAKYIAKCCVLECKFFIYRLCGKFEQRE